MRVFIVGGVAGGASCAARLRRLNEEAEIVILERGPYVSFANCGLPYYVGGVIEKESQLFLSSPEAFRARFRIDVRVENEVLSIDRTKKTIHIKNHLSGDVYSENYDYLVLSPGASPIVPPINGIHLEGVFTLRTVPEASRILQWIQERKAQSALVVGGGFIGLEMAENLIHRGLKVTLVERLNQVMGSLDPEMAFSLQELLIQKGIDLVLGDGVESFQASHPLQVRTTSGRSWDVDLVILALGIRPEVNLAHQSGLPLGKGGGIVVDEFMRTEDPFIFAVGDAVEVEDAIVGGRRLLPLAGPANRQGRMVAEVICSGPLDRPPPRFRGVQGTSICGLFGHAVASTGANEKTLQRAGLKPSIDYERIWLYPYHHVTYYPGYRRLHLKLLFQKRDGKILGAQAFGEEDVARKIDVLSLAIQNQNTVYDLEEMELCYSPQFGGAKDPLNFAGMIGANHLRGDMPLADWSLVHDLAYRQKEGIVLLDVRDVQEIQSRGKIEGAVNIPLNELRSLLDSEPRPQTSDRVRRLMSGVEGSKNSDQSLGVGEGFQEVWVYCEVGQRGYYATRLLLQKGFLAKNLSGGHQTYKKFQGMGLYSVGNEKK